MRTLRNDVYWANRMRILEEALLDTGYEYMQNLERQYELAMRAVEEQMAAWYQRFAKNNQISLIEAQRLLSTREWEEFRWSVEEYIRHGQEHAISKEWAKELENASARVHISRLDSLKLQLQQQAELLYGNQLDGLDALIRRIYSEGYYHTAFEIQKGMGIGWTLHSLNDDVIRKVLSRPWTSDGQTFSDRIWSNKQKLVQTVNTQLTQMMMRGTAPDGAIKAISERFQVSKSQAGRLVMTESAAFSNIARRDCFIDLGVERFVIVETLDSETCQLCGQLDGKVFPMGEYAVGVTAPPFHPWCRGTTAPYFEDMQGIGERVARDDKGNSYEVPKDMSYEEWKAALQRERETINKIKNKPSYSEAYRKKMIDTYYDFRASGIEMTDHSLNRFLGQKASKTPFTKSDVCDIMNKTINYVQESDSRMVRFYPPLSIVTDSVTKEVVSIVVDRMNPKSDWRRYE